MAVTKKGRKRKWHTDRLHWPGRRHAHDEENGRSEADRLTPLEETDEFRRSRQEEGDAAAVNDTIRVDNKSVRMPDHLLDEDREGSSVFRLEPVVVCVLLGMLAFIAFIAWQVTLMPEK